ncbi:hypothetical protein D9615_010257 [Tricholomella constricta]|uniref:HMG box domain-containing protein n=1 Tax=Tricholomella constricta TaxID=117010 RepID=A0A8H5LUA8_9AGAR|nr:hypothetical protein D9615_010257 [Tricholomella constricta]
MPSAHPYKTPRTEKIPRPPNSFILYRSAMASRLPSPPPGTTRSQGDVSRLVALMWHNETPEVKAEYRQRASIRKLEHEAMYPDYSYRPRSREEMEMDSRDMRRQRKATCVRGGPTEPDLTARPFLSAPRSQSHNTSSQPPPYYQVLLDQAAQDLVWKEQNDDLAQALEGVSVNADGSFNFDHAQSSFNHGLDTSLGQPWDSYAMDSQFDISLGAESSSAAEDRLFDQYNNYYPEFDYPSFTNSL